MEVCFAHLLPSLRNLLLLRYHPDRCPCCMLWAAWVQARFCEQHAVLLLLNASSSECAGVVLHQLCQLWGGQGGHPGGTGMSETQGKADSGGDGGSRCSCSRARSVVNFLLHQ